MSSAPRFIPHYTLADYRRWEGDWELIDGVPVSMSPSPFGPHERIVSRLSRMIGNQLESQKCPCEVYTNLDWIVSEDTVIRPDLMVVCGEQPQQHLQRPPALLVEVLSESTRGRDLTVKRSLCHEHRVAQYVVVDPDAGTVLLFTGHEADGAEATTLEAADTLSLMLNANCEITIDIGKLFDGSTAARHMADTPPE